ncbi:putative DNA-binding domain-containing protein [Ideonella azotifigens]|uniref:DNA-binding domain-containing protein n=1 Tax=Ideonella azotifigens TaxID=513160 RepID=A0ABN1JYW5_9BURK|nr:DNA-binding domain-containing protein [Ideonella azotifigens]MCD2342784.1 putative DNA-binding domain-containing protein [Ideonella azotifigens]
MTLDSLRNAQLALAALIQQAEAPPAAALPPLLRALHGRPESPQVSLGIYRNAWRGRLIEALRSNYPVLHRVLGDDDFAELAMGFIAHHPPHTPSIRWFGAALPAYLQQQPNALPHPALSDLARMEWALGLSFDAADAAPLDGAQLATLAPQDWVGLRLAAHASLQLLELDWAVEPLWQQLTHAPEDADTRPPEPLQHQLLVWRQALDTRWRSLQTEEAALLQATLAGVPFGELGHVAAQQVGDEAAPGLLASALQTWVNQGLLVMRVR